MTAFGVSILGIDILPITCFLANFLQSSILLNCFLRKENSGNLFSFSEAAHGPYRPMTLSFFGSKFLSFIFEEVKLLMSIREAFNHLLPATPRPARAVCFRNWRRLFFIFFGMNSLPGSFSQLNLGTLNETSPKYKV